MWAIMRGGTMSRAMSGCVYPPSRSRRFMSLRKNGFPGTQASRLARLFAAPMAFGACLLIGAPASAASLAGPISGWQKGNEPSWVSMYEYVPANLAANSPLLVLVHYCSGNAAGVFGEAQGGGIIAAADKY